MTTGHAHVMVSRQQPPAVDEANLFVRGVRAAAGGDIDGWVLAIAARYLNNRFPGDGLLPPPLLDRFTKAKLGAAARELLGDEAKRSSLVVHLVRHAGHAVQRLDRVMQGLGPVAQRAVFVRAAAEDFFARFPAPYSYERLWLWVGAASGGHPEKLGLAHRDEIADLIWAHAAEWDPVSRPALRDYRRKVLRDRADVASVRLEPVEGPSIPEIPATPDEVTVAAMNYLKTAKAGTVTPRTLWNHLQVTLRLAEGAPLPAYSDHVLIAMAQHREALGLQTHRDLDRALQDRRAALHELGFEVPIPPPPAPRAVRARAAAPLPTEAEILNNWRNLHTLPPAARRALVARLPHDLPALRRAGYEPPFDYLPEEEKGTRIQTLVVQWVDQVQRDGTITKPLPAMRTLLSLLPFLHQHGVILNEDQVLAYFPRFSSIIWEAVDRGIVEERFARARCGSRPATVAAANPAPVAPVPAAPPHPAAPPSPPSEIPQPPPPPQAPPPPARGAVTAESLAAFLGTSPDDPRITDIVGSRRN